MQILIADGHPPYQDVLAAVLTSLQPGAEIRSVDDYDALIAALGSQPYRMVITDLTLPGVRGLAEIIELVNAAGETPLTVVSSGHSRDVHRRMRVCGVSGLLERDAPPEQISRTLAMVLRGGLAFPEIMAVPSAAALPPAQSELTSRQMRVLSLLTKGKSNKQIAKDLSLSPNTVKAHVSEILRKLEVDGRNEVIAMAMRPMMTLQAAD